MKTGDELEILANEFNDLASKLQVVQDSTAEAVREREEQYQSAQRRVREMSSLLKSGRAITSLDLENVLDNLARESAGTAGADRSAIYVLNEAQHILAGYLPKVYANAPINKELKLPNSFVSQEHCIVDLGEDEFTVGRLHPMMDNEMRIRRLIEEAGDPSVAVIMLDVVIGYGSHPNPASELAPAVAKAIDLAQKAGRHLEVVAVVTGTDEDPQNFSDQIQQLKQAGAWVSPSNEDTVRYAGAILQALEQKFAPPASVVKTPVDLSSLQKPLEAINVGLDSFAENLKAQGTPTVHVDWRPPAGGNERMMSILEKMKKK